MMEDSVLERSEKHFKDPPQLFTYYQGDINTAVDEHFFRALNKATIPTDLSTKAKESNRTSISDVSPSSSSSWAFSGLTWSKSPHSSNPSRLTQLTSINEPPPSQGVIMNPPGLSSASSLWPCPSRQDTAFELPLSLYQQPAESSANSYLNLLQIERPTGGIMISPFSKSDRPEWNAGTAFKDTSGSRIGLDSGVPVAEISKDLYWY
ncbi:transcription cofactor vestigial-like protein 1 [Xyrauchen texanus]|uniref:transcription cofactor vestigial-like protein 1 n=1 Tax=Xyrauchen texanus TaxID=154827 RepID=UPI002242BFAF|nr:transcription cofactor vestigial-like protein 1 [Xyrauchen texanus]